MVEGYVQCFAAALFSLIFLFLWRQSGLIYFGYWSLAWIVELLVWGFRDLAFATKWPEFVGQGERATFLACRALVLGAIYFGCFQRFHEGRRRFFRFALLALSVLYLQSAAAYLFITPTRLGYMHHIDDVDLALQTVLAFSAMALWIENQNDRMEQMVRELAHMRRDPLHDGSLDYLTGLLNQDALRRRLDTDESFKGVVAVCDLDGFKSINDRFGHVVGDEVLRNVGNLLRSSIRAEDLAYRWGGDELAVLFCDQEASLAQSRMAGIEARLENFRVRGYTSLRIRFSWGVAEGNGVPLREVLERADQEMYSKKRAKMTKQV